MLLIMKHACIKPWMEILIDSLEVDKLALFYGRFESSRDNHVMWNSITFLNLPNPMVIMELKLGPI